MIDELRNLLPDSLGGWIVLCAWAWVITVIRLWAVRVRERLTEIRDAIKEQTAWLKEDGE